jgi:iron(III) transport system substrate-binding protein
MNRLLVLLSLVFATQNLPATEAVNVYSARKEALIKPLLDRFTETTGIKVNLVTGKADELLTRLLSESRNTPADVLITVDAGSLQRAKAAGAFQPIADLDLAHIVPESYRDPDNQWVGLSLRARVIFYAQDRVAASELSTYEDLADPKWKGRICVRSSDNIYNQSLVAAMIAAHGADETEQWVQGLVSNMARPPKGGDRDQILAAAAGQCDLAIANTYYYAQMLTSENDPNQRHAAEKMTILWPNQKGRGVHVNISGAGITRHAKNRANAFRLLAYLLSLDAQQWYAAVNYEYPVRKDVSISNTLAAWGAFTADAVNLSTLGEYNATAIKLMDRAGWK